MATPAWAARYEFLVSEALVEHTIQPITAAVLDGTAGALAVLLAVAAAAVGLATTASLTPRRSFQDNKIDWLGAINGGQ